MRASITDFPIPVPSSISVSCLFEVSTMNIRASYSSLGVIGTGSSVAMTLI